MTTATETILHQRRTLGDLLSQLGGVSADRVRLIPSPGTATEQDAINNPSLPLHRRHLCRSPTASGAGLNDLSIVDHPLPTPR